MVRTAVRFKYRVVWKMKQEEEEGMKGRCLMGALAAVMALSLTSCAWRDDPAQGGMNTAPPADPGTGAEQGQETAPQVKRTSRIHRSAYDYLHDGTYRADQRGRVAPGSGEPGRDLTRGARDLLRDAGDMARRAADDVGSAVKNAGEQAGAVTREIFG